MMITNSPRLALAMAILLGTADEALSFSPASMIIIDRRSRSRFVCQGSQSGTKAFLNSSNGLHPSFPRGRTIASLSASPDLSDEDKEGAIELSEEAKKEAVGNLVEDDEWAGLTMELGDIVKKAVEEDLKKNAREFLGKDDYKLGDVSKEIDSRVKQGVADLRGKESYEVGDLVLTLDEMSKSMTEELTGKPYETGDLSREIDSRIKSAVADYCGKDAYEVGDLSRAVASKVSETVDELVGDYEFGDISREVERRRREWVKDFLGEDAAASYQFGDISKKFATMYTGKGDYQFGDVTKKLMGDLFGKKKGKEQ